MGFSSAFSSLIRGNFTDAFNYAWVPESEIQRSNTLDNRLQEFIAADQAKGIISQEEANAAYARIAANAFQPGGIFEQEGTSPIVGFGEGLKEGANNIRKTGEGAISGILGLGARLIPWQVWVALFVLVLIWLAPYWLPLAKRLTGAKT